MKREILFKAKRIDNGEWAEGQLAYLFDNKETPYIMPNCYFATREMGEDEDDKPIISDEMCLGGFISVHPETVCQFTGLLDKNGNKIFEGDVIKNYQAHENIVHWFVDSWCYKNYHAESLPLGSYHCNPYINVAMGEDENITDHEIIGNIHDK